MTAQAKGTFDIKGTPRSGNDVAESLNARRMMFHKTFHGDLQGTSVVEMLGIMNEELASGAYVALERFTGAVGGRRGSFYLQHSSTMTRGAPSQRIMVVPDSGAEGLAGITGSMTIEIVDKKHFYVFSYSFSQS